MNCIQPQGLNISDFFYSQNRSTTMEDKRTWDCVKSPSKQLLCTTLLLRTIFCSALGSSRRAPTSPSNVVAKKSPHFHPFCSKSNFVWGGRGGVASFSHITGKVPTLLTSIVDLASGKSARVFVFLCSACKFSNLFVIML